MFNFLYTAVSWVLLQWHHLFSAMGLQLSDDDIETLVRRTEGWPAGLCLAGRSMSARGDQRRAVAAFGGNEQAVATYLRAGREHRLSAFCIATQVQPGPHA